MVDLFKGNTAKKEHDQYSASDIEVLEGLEPVRRRPGMYIGGTDENALHHLVSEVFDNSMDEAVAGYAKFIELELSADNSITITDNGRGIPVDPHPKFPKKSALEVILTTLHSGGKFSNKVYYTSGGLHGVGISVVNALSDQLTVTVTRDKTTWQQSYKRGMPTSKLEKIGTSNNKRGTQVTFHPDPEIFSENTKFKPHKLYKLARSKAYLFKGVEIRWKCASELLTQNKHNVPESETIHFPNGILDYLDSVTENDEKITDQPFNGEVQFPEKKGRIEWAIHWAPTHENTLQSYCNTVVTPQGGTHESGLKTALLKGLKEYGERTNIKKTSQITSDDIASNMVGILSLFIPEPQFQGQTKEKLANKEASKLVENAVKDRFDHWLSGNKQNATALLNYIIEKTEERLSKKQQKEVNRKSATQRLRLPGKLADCSRQTPEGTEVFLVEGDSAGGSAKMARNRETQAILPLRGKILNVASATKDKILANQEISDINLALGCGTGEHFKEASLRYEKIIIMTDADVDGAHIASLLMTYFFREMPELIRQGHLFLAKPPLYRITHNNKSYYIASENEKNKLTKKLESQRGKIETSRFKGLGEMTPAQLKETTMNPANRTLLKVIIEEGTFNNAEKKVEHLMGKKPELRFKFITEQSAILPKELSETLDI